MPEIAAIELPPAPPGLHGFVTAAPVALGAPFTVLCPEFSPEHAFEIRRWQSRALTMPAVGDEVLVVFDDEQEPWAAAWWPAGGDAAITGGVEVEEWLTGSTVPAGGLGSNGDLYLRTTTADVYEKVGGVWGIVANIKGATGSTGAKGEAGATGGSVVDYGIVTALPTSGPTPAKGYLCTFKAATGVYWQLVYTEEATYPWAVISGPPLVSQSAGLETTLESTSTTYSTTGSPTAISVPLAMEADVSIGSAQALTTEAALSSARIAAFKASTEFAYAAMAGSSSFDGAPMFAQRRGTLAKAESLTFQYKAEIAGKKIRILGAYLILDPVRVG